MNGERHGDLGAGDAGCSVRCLPRDAALDARALLTRDGIQAVAFVCAISGRSEEAVLIGSGLAERLVALQPSVQSALHACILASLDRASLCACDIATLLDVAQPEVERHLRELAQHGLIDPASVAEMPIYGLAERGRVALAALAEIASSESSSRSTATTTTTLQLAACRTFASMP